MKAVYGISGVCYLSANTDIFLLLLRSMESSELPHLPNSLPLGSQLPSGFNPHDVQSFQSFSSAIGDIDHNLQAASNFVSLHTSTYLSYIPSDAPRLLITYLKTAAIQ